MLFHRIGLDKLQMYAVDNTGEFLICRTGLDSGSTDTLSANLSLLEFVT